MKEDDLRGKLGAKQSAELRLFLDRALWQTEPEEPVVCSTFACGRTLTAQEQLYGGKCINHSKQINK